MYVYRQTTCRRLIFYNFWKVIFLLTERKPTRDLISFTLLFMFLIFDKSESNMFYWQRRKLIKDLVSFKLPFVSPDSHKRESNMCMIYLLFIHPFFFIRPQTALQCTSFFSFSTMLANLIGDFLPQNLNTESEINEIYSKRPSVREVVVKFTIQGHAFNTIKEQEISV